MQSPKIPMDNHNNGYIVSGLTLIQWAYYWGSHLKNHPLIRWIVTFFISTRTFFFWHKWNGISLQREESYLHEPWKSFIEHYLPFATFQG